MLQRPIFAALALAVLLTGRAAGAADAKTILLRDVTLIDVTASDAASARLPHQSILIRDGKIERIGPTATWAGAADRIIDASGQFAIPGLWDMHTHLLRGVVDDELPMFVANGVLSIRDMGTDIDAQEYARIRADIRQGSRVGPDIVASAGRIFEGAGGKHAPIFQNIEKDTVVATVVDAHKRAGWDFVKPYSSLTREQYFALAKAAQAANLPVSGHVPLSISAVEAADAGQRTIEHAITMPYDCSHVGAYWRERFDRTVRGLESMAELRREQREGARYREIVETFDPKLCASIARQMASRNMYLVPTHVTRRMEAFANLPEYFRDPRLKYIRAGLRRIWDPDRAQEAAKPLVNLASYTDFYYLGLRITKLAHDTGVKIMLGTDAADSFIFPGFSVHDELYELVAAGLTPLEALRAATMVSADYMGATARTGSLAPGKDAQIVLLERDPLADIQNSSAIRAVVQKGHYQNRAELDALLARVAEQVARSDAAR